RVVPDVHRRLQQVFYPGHGRRAALDIEDGGGQRLGRVDQQAEYRDIGHHVPAGEAVPVAADHQHPAGVQDDGEDAHAERLGEGAGQVPAPVHLVADMKKAVVDPDEFCPHDQLGAEAFYDADT